MTWIVKPTKRLFEAELEFLKDANDPRGAMIDNKVMVYTDEGYDYFPTTMVDWLDDNIANRFYVYHDFSHQHFPRVYFSNDTDLAKFIIFWHGKGEE